MKNVLEENFERIAKLNAMLRPTTLAKIKADEDNYWIEKILNCPELHNRLIQACVIRFYLDYEISVQKATGLLNKMIQRGLAEKITPENRYAPIKYIIIEKEVD